MSEILLIYSFIEWTKILGSLSILTGVAEIRICFIYYVNYQKEDLSFRIFKNCLCICSISKSENSIYVENWCKGIYLFYLFIYLFLFFIFCYYYYLFIYFITYSFIYEKMYAFFLFSHMNGFKSFINLQWDNLKDLNQLCCCLLYWVPT